MFLSRFVNFLVYIYNYICFAWIKIPMPNNMKEYVFKLYCCENEIVNGNKIPLPRSGHRIVCDSTNLYSFGGYNPLVVDNSNDSSDEGTFNAHPLFQELWKFNFASKKWKCYKGKQYLPQELASNAVVLSGNYLMVYGGTGSPFAARSSNQLYICPLRDEVSRMVEIVTTGNHPEPQYGQALVYHDNYLYTIGGTTGFTYSCDIHRVNMKSKVWEIVYICNGLADYEPTGRYRHEVAFDGSNIYVLGGGTADVAFDFCAVPAFNIERKKWIKMETKRDPKIFGCGKPSARRCHGAVQIELNNDIHVFISGGYDGDTVYDDLWRLELSTMQWTCIEKCVFPRPIYFHSAAVCPEGKMYVFGGIYERQILRRDNKIHSLWLCIPKLSEMCWEAILHYHPEIVNFSKERLINIGLPRTFISRLES